MARPRFCTILSALVAALLGGCTTLAPESCEQFEEQRKHINYATEYRLETARIGNDVRPLGRNELAAAHNYRMRLNTDKARPCMHVKIQKELVLERRDINANLVLEETREFYTDSGVRIATKNEVLTDQLRESGRYSATVLLPIPKRAPPGKYRLVSTLMLKLKGNPQPQILARSTANFHVTAPNK